MVIISQQHFLYNSAIFIPINATSIPAPTKHPPQISILISQYIIPATTGLDIPLLICAMFFVADIIHPAMVCTKVAIVSKNTTQSEINIFDRINYSFSEMCIRDRDVIFTVSFSHFSIWKFPTECKQIEKCL